MQSQILVVHPPLPLYPAPNTACLEVTSLPCFCCVTRSSAATFRSAWSTLWARWPCCTQSNYYGLSVAQYDTHVLCVSPESANRRERNGLLGPFAIFLRLRKWRGRLFLRIIWPRGAFCICKKMHPYSAFLILCRIGCNKH